MVKALWKIIFKQDICHHSIQVTTSIIDFLLVQSAWFRCFQNHGQLCKLRCLVGSPSCMISDRSSFDWFSCCPCLPLGHRGLACICFLCHILLTGKSIHFPPASVLTVFPSANTFSVPHNNNQDLWENNLLNLVFKEWFFAKYLLWQVTAFWSVRLVEENFLLFVRRTCVFYFCVGESQPTLLGLKSLPFTCIAGIHLCEPWPATLCLQMELSPEGFE
jgi:hypothetical protein